MFITTCQRREDRRGKEMDEETYNVIVSLQIFIKYILKSILFNN